MNYEAMTNEDVRDLRGVLLDCRFMLKREGVDERSNIMQRVEFVLNVTSGRLPENYHLAEDEFGRIQVYHGVLPELLTSEFFYTDRMARVYCWKHATNIVTERKEG